MDINWNTKLYCLIGDPIEKSLSPAIHNSIFKELKEDSIYIAFNIKKENLEDAINGFKVLDIKGFNVTIPYKKEIIKHLDDISPVAEIIGAVNTVKNENGKLIGYNTDGGGFLKTLYDNNINIKNKNILILGAGGAAYGIAVSLAKSGVGKIHLNNRNLHNAISLEKKIKLINSEIEINVGDLNLEHVDKKNIDIIINSTSVGMYPMEDLSPIELNGFSRDAIIYDIVYKPKKTKLIKDGIAKGCRTFGGISMLLNQAILSQEIWLSSDKKINTKIVKNIEGILSTHVE